MASETMVARRLQVFPIMVGIALFLGVAVSPVYGQTDTGSRFIKKSGSHDVIVFVHGLTGNARDTWLNKGTQTYWPELTAKDEQLAKHFDVYVVDYYSPLLTHAQTIEEVTTQILGELQDRSLFRDYKSLIFVTHSMGGLIVKNLLVKLNTPGNESKLRQVHAVIYLGTPAQGSDGASWARWLTLNRQLSDLLPADANTFLQSLENNWQNLMQERNTRKALYPKSFCVYETLPTALGTIVSRRNAQTFCDGGINSMPFNHIDIVKPSGPEDNRHIWMRSRLLELGDDATNDAVPSVCQSAEQPAADVSQPRLRVSIFKHGGTDSATGKDAFGHLVELFRDRLITIRERLTEGSDKDRKYLARLADCLIEQGLSADDELSQQYLQDTHSLELISGALFIEQQTVFARSQVFLGDVGGTMRRIPIEMKVSRNSFGSMRDLFSLVTIYALIMDAKRLNMPVAVRLDYAQKALAILKDITPKTEQIERLKNILRHEAEELKVKR